MTRVYMPNLPMRKHPDTRVWVPSIDVEPARRHGEVIVLLSQDEVSAGVANCARALKTRLADSSPGDFLLCTGRPVLQMLMGMLWSQRHPGCPVRALEWDRRLSEYIAVEVKP